MANRVVEYVNCRSTDADSPLYSAKTPSLRMIRHANFKTGKFPSCCVCNATFNRSNGCVMHDAPAAARPPKYHRAIRVSSEANTENLPENRTQLVTKWLAFNYPLFNWKMDCDIDIVIVCVQRSIDMGAMQLARRLHDLLIQFGCGNINWWRQCSLMMMMT